MDAVSVEISAATALSVRVRLGLGGREGRRGCGIARGRREMHGREAAKQEGQVGAWCRGEGDAPDG